MDAKMIDDLLQGIKVVNATPTYKRTREYLDGVRQALGNECGPNGDPDLDSLCEATVSAIRACSTLTNTEPNDMYSLEKAGAAMEQAFVLLKKIERLYPEGAETVHATAQMMMVSWNMASNCLINARIAREIPAMRPIARIHAAKAAAVERAQAIATELWKADTSKEARLGNMAERVYRALIDEGFAELLPGTAERLKEWIKPVAPDYARKGGRRRKHSERIG